MKILPTVEIAQQVVPTPPEPPQPPPPEDPPEWPTIWVEVTGELTHSGQVIRPRWFDALRSAYAWDPALGIRKRWVKGTTMTPNQGPSRARLVELWKFPRDAYLSIPAEEAYVFTDEQTAEDRVTYHDLGW